MEEKIGNKMKHKNLYRENVLLYNENFKMLPVLDYCLRGFLRSNLKLNLSFDQYLSAVVLNIHIYSESE